MNKENNMFEINEMNKENSNKIINKDNLNEITEDYN